MIGIDTNILVFAEIAEMPSHAAARALLCREVFDGGEKIAMAPQVLAEFVHIVTDARRFVQPVSMPDALARARSWWEATEVHRVFPTAKSTRLMLDWMVQFSLGRKRVLDTQLAATLLEAGVRRVLTGNVHDFAIFDVFELIAP